MFDRILYGFIAFTYILLAFVSFFTDWAPDPLTVEIAFLYLGGIFFFRLMDSIFGEEE